MLWFPRVFTSATTLVLLVLTGRIDDSRTPHHGIPQLTVTADPDSVQQLGNLGSVTAYFLVQNVGTTTFTNIAMTCTATGPVACVSVNPTNQASLAPGASREVEITYTTAAAGVGTIRLTATASGGTSAYAVQTVTLLAAPTITLVAPTGTFKFNRGVVRTRQPRVLATWLPGDTASGQAIDSTTVLLTWRGVNVTTQARYNRGLLEWEPDSAQGLGTVGSSVADSAQLTIRVCAVSGACTTMSPYIVLPNDSKPILGFSGVPYEALGRAFTTPFGPGLSVTAGEIETGISTVPYFSMGSPRSTGLAYSTRQSYPRVLIPVDLELTWPAGTPSDITFILKDGATRLDSVRFVSPTCATGAVRRCRAVLQGDFGTSTFSVPTRKWLRVEGRVKSGSTTNTSIDSVEVVLVDRRATRYGSGWWPTAGVLLAAAGGDRLMVSATGAVSVFRGNGDSLFLAPPGSAVVLKRVGAMLELAPHGSLAETIFDTATGRLRSSRDISGNVDSVSWDVTTDKILKVRDPMGKEITFSYNGGGTLATIGSLSGGALRQMRVTINATTNQLTSDSMPAAPGSKDTTAYVYQVIDSVRKSVVLTKLIGVLQDTTVVVYDSTAKRRPVQVRLPTVVDSSGASVNPVIAYWAREYQGVASLRPLDSAYVQITDPRMFWSRSLLNRWGQAVRTWDAIGLLGRASFFMDGRPQWAEGKVADSSRVWTAYDNLRRVVKTYWLRAAADTLRLDSLAYDTHGWVIRQVDSRDSVTAITYDTLGRPIRTIGPGSDSSFVWYRSDGRVDSTRTSGASAIHYTYEATWGNRFEVLGPDSQLLARTRYDAVGRDTLSESKLRVQVTGTTTSWQWRKVRTWYTTSNQVDSTRLMRGSNCASPCSAPSYPGTFDSTQVQTVSWRRDGAGRDTARVNTRRVATTYRLDRLGRVVSRRPWSDSVGVKDSLVYDVAGNVIKTITRRGYVITTNYDSRNRDTLAIIPTVGTLRRLYAGPADQLTRQWIQSPVDSIGGVNSELRWAYDLRGRLVSDTAYSGTVPRAQSYTYDIWERPASRIDAVGSWQTRYETARSLPDTLVTPMGDSVSLTLDRLGRAPSLKMAGQAGSPVQLATMSWNLTGGLTSLDHQVNVFSSPTWSPLKFDRLDAIDSVGGSLVWYWLRQAGPAASADTLRDSVTYDGWSRVTRWKEWSSAGGGADLVRNYSFDPSGNLFGGGGLIYDSVTNRLTKGGGGFLQYDRAGNLTTHLGAGVTYAYDALERLVSVRKGTTIIARYGYDVAGRRIVKRVYDSTTGGTIGYLRMVYAGNQVAFESDSGSTSLTTIYTWGPGVDNLLAVKVGSTQYTVVTDALGSVRAIVQRSDGAWKGRLRYDPYGQLIDSAGPQPVLRYRWTGREYDTETGFYFHRSRYYDPKVGRFIQEDQIGYAGGNNLYAYVGGDVLQVRDPDGHYTATPWGVDPTRNGNCMEASGAVVPCGASSPGFGGGAGLGVYRVVVNGKFMGITVTTPLLGVNTKQIVAMVLEEQVAYFISRYGNPSPRLAPDRPPTAPSSPFRLAGSSINSPNVYFIGAGAVVAFNGFGYEIATGMVADLETGEEGLYFRRGVIIEGTAVGAYWSSPGLVDGWRLANQAA
jgi:RHS repeat-associated protein